MSITNNVSITNSRDEMIQSYSMHVSARYLDLTKQKLEVTRLPREPSAIGPGSWQLGTPKALLEPLIDYWLGQYDWRNREAFLNSHLPQYRTTITPSVVELGSEGRSKSGAQTSQRIHFVHKPSEVKTAIPLLFCHGWPGSFLEASKIIDALTAAGSATKPPRSDASPSFHVVVPSIPGFGFSDASEELDFGPPATADCFDALMKRLGYQRYVSHGSGYGFDICRLLSARHPNSCLAIHTFSPKLPAPTFSTSLLATLKYRIACLTGARYHLLAFGYTPTETGLACDADSDIRQGGSGVFSYSTRPQTHSYALADSPSGLLACVLDLLRPPRLEVPQDLPSSRLPPSSSSGHVYEQYFENPRRTGPSAIMEPIRESIESPPSIRAQPPPPAWSPTDVLDWAMMMWLPGPESGLRWLDRAARGSSSNPDRSSLWDEYTSVPIGISTFRLPGSDTRSSEHTNIDLAGASDAQIESGQAQITDCACKSRFWDSKGLRKRWKSVSRAWRTAVDGPVSATPEIRLSSPPMWVAPYQNPQWVRRHDVVSQTPIWEVPDLAVQDIRDCFGEMVRRGLVREMAVERSGPLERTL